MSEKEEQIHHEEKEVSHLYQWDYSVQNQHDSDLLKKKRKSSVLTFILGMSVTLLICLGLVFGAVLIDRAKTPTTEEIVTPTTEQVAAVVSPQIVLITAESGDDIYYGTGFFIRENGYIATNYHVLQGADSIQVRLYSGVVKKATLVGYSFADDLAVIKISGSGYPTVTVGNSDTVRAGAKAIIVGHPSGTMYPWTVSQGIVSFPSRTIAFSDDCEIIEMNLMQFDVSVSNGNSGGPLFNERGQVIGVVNRKDFSQDGVGMAIPINGAMRILNALIETGTADGIVSTVSKSRPLLGIVGTTVQAGDPYYDDEVMYTAGHDGVLILSVGDTGAAIEVAKPGDILISFNGRPLSTMEELTAMLYDCKPGDTVLIELWRDGESIQRSVTFANRK